MRPAALPAPPPTSDARYATAHAVAGQLARIAAAHPAAFPLSRREQQVAAGVVAELSYREIARWLGCAERTAKNHAAATADAIAAYPGPLRAKLRAYVRTVLARLDVPAQRGAA